MNTTERLARISARRPWIVITAWATLILAGGFFAAGIGDVLTTQFLKMDNPESARANALIEDRLSGPERAQEVVVVQSETAHVADPAFRAFVESLVSQLRALDGTVAAATSYYDTNDKRLIAADRTKTLVVVSLRGNTEDAADNVAPLLHLVARMNGQGGFEALSIGEGSIGHTFKETSQKDLQKGELIGIPVALLILILVFGAVVAAGLPVILAIAAIVVTIGTTAIIGRMFDLNVFVVNITTMVGLAIGIDYSLFIVYRFREERAGGLAKDDAIARAGATASRAVLFSGAIVVAGLLGLFIVPSNLFRSLALGAVGVTLFAVAAALTLLPALLSLLGDRINAGRLPFLRTGVHRERLDGFWGVIARTVMRHPLISAVASAGILIAAALPFLGIERGLAGVKGMPQNTNVHRAFDALDSDFSLGLISPTKIVIDAPDVTNAEVKDAIEKLQTGLHSDPSFGATTVQTNEAGDLAVVSVILNGDPEGQPAHDAVQRLRNQYVRVAFNGVDANVLVTGLTATEEDFFQTIATYTPIVFAFTLGLSFVLLLLAFRSIVVPVKALIMNVLSVGAAYGLLVLVFQDGVGNELLGFRQTDTIAAWLPLFIFAFLFGISMDYHVFLLSRIRERFDQTGDNEASIAFGLTSTAGLITGAALIMVAVFAGFALGGLTDLQQTGFGLAVAVLVDATIVRSVLVPASMQLLGKWNWYLPGWLLWLPQLRVEATPAGQRTTKDAGGHFSTSSTSG